MAPRGLPRPPTESYWLGGAGFCNFLHGWCFSCSALIPMSFPHASTARSRRAIHNHSTPPCAHKSPLLRRDPLAHTCHNKFFFPTPRPAMGRSRSPTSPFPTIEPPIMGFFAAINSFLTSKFTSQLSSCHFTLPPQVTPWMQARNF